ncbi:DNA-3-methyladenine glycosylase family protein [Aristophania vespae]|uniref:DNA-3-methyladenine glycosylase family protein n=1 Tax=Aristophania vespae TaxID=2697033 RepID=UPI00235175A2|nr:DNA-3-methyladenine glycosylase 2 family protein [Aristophania vespae]
MAQLPTPFLNDPDIYAYAQKVGTDQLFHNATSSFAASQFKEPYEALIHAITGQHLHSKAVKTIFARLCSLNKTESGTVTGNEHPPSAKVLLSLKDSSLRECGLSNSKIRALKGIAQAQLEGIIPSAQQAKTIDDETLITQLTSLYGVGRWTVEMLLLFTLDRPDIFPADDFGVREGWRRIKKLPQSPSPKELYKITEVFSPHRSLLTYYCWHAKERLLEPTLCQTAP